jgi:hypothetical protein
MEAPIPDKWKREVCSVLKKDEKGKILIRTSSAWLPWSGLFPNSFRFELYEALARCLSERNVCGKQVFNMEEPGETYEFFFSHENRKLYGKICLGEDGQTIIIYSAHLPERDTL